MDILNLLNHELKDKNWDTEEQMRYLYNRSCTLFSFDPRYDFLSNQDDADEIWNRPIDLRNFSFENKDHWVICKSWAKQVFPVFLQEFLELDVSIVGVSHCWDKIDTEIMYIKADATESSDLTRVKMNLSTKGYISLDGNYLFSDKLKQLDQNIGYIQEDYEDTFIKRKCQGLKESFSLINHSNFSNDDYIIFQWYTIKEMFERYSRLSEFSDAEFAISYLKNMVTQQFRFWKTDIVCLFQQTSENIWDFMNIYPVKLASDMLYFALQEDTAGLSFYEIGESDALYYTKEMSGKNKHLIIR